MYLIESTDNFRSLVERAALNDEDLTLKLEGLRAVPIETRRELLRLEIAEVVKAYNTEKDKASKAKDGLVGCAMLTRCSGDALNNRRGLEGRLSAFGRSWDLSIWKGPSLQMVEFMSS
jgi:hypothetical protein